MKIAMLVPPWIKLPPKGYGGIEVLVSLLTDSLVEKGHDVTLFSVGTTKTKGKLFSVFEDEMIHYLNKPVSSFLNAAAAHTLTSYMEIEKGGFDIIEQPFNIILVADIRVFGNNIRTAFLKLLNMMRRVLPGRFPGS